MKQPPLLWIPFSILLFSQPVLAQRDAAKWVLTFAEEFNGSELDLSRWSLHNPLPPVPGQPRADTPEIVTVGSGQLHLRTGVVSTFGTFAQTYGRFEIRCLLPAGSGFRLLPIQPGNLPAIDVFETRGSAPAKVSFANHWGTEQTERSFGESFTGPDFSNGFHTIAVEWDRDRIAWFIDGKQKFQSVDGIPHQPMYMLFALSGGASSFDIDYIRVYRRQ